MKGRRLSALAGVLVAGITAAILLTSGGGTRKPHTTTTRPSIPAPRMGPQFGANVGRLFNERTYSPPAIASQLSALRGTGATLARSDAFWEATEPTPPSGGVHRYDWGFDDSIAAALAAARLGWLPIIDYSAPWAQSIPGRQHSPPSSPADYAAYAAAVAARYGSGGRFWSTHPSFQPRPIGTYEVWNEPDNTIFWYRSPDAARYAQLYLRARAAIHAVQPAARVLVGGLAHPSTFLPALLAAAPEVRGRLDGVAIHSYGATPDAVVRGVAVARQTLDRLGMAAVPLYVTEFGWTTSPPGALDYLPAPLRPGYIDRTLSKLGHVACGLSAIFIYAWVTPSTNPRDPQDWFGIHPPGGGSTPDTQAFSSGISAAASPPAAGEACPRP